MALRRLFPGMLAVCVAAVPLLAQQATPASPPPANDTVKGAALLSDARKALGGEDKLAAIKRLEVKGTITQVQANQTLDGDIALQIEAPDKMRIEEEISLPGGAITISRTQGLNGTDFWDETEGGLPGGFGRGGRGGDFRGGGPGGRLGGVLGGLGTDPNAQGRGQLSPEIQAQLRERQLRQRQTDLARYLVAFLASTAEAPAWIGTAVTPRDEKADVLEFKTPDGTSTRLFLDIATHMPLMMTFDGPAARGAGRQGGGPRGRGDGAGPAAGTDAAAAPPAANAPPVANAPQGGRRGGGIQAQPVTMEMYLGDYKVENGIRMPHHITREISGEIQEEFIFKNFKFNPNFKANTFTQPKQ